MNSLWFRVIVVLGVRVLSKLCQVCGVRLMQDEGLGFTLSVDPTEYQREPAMESPNNCSSLVGR